MAAGGINVSTQVDRSTDVTWSDDEGIKVGRWVAAHSDAAATTAADGDDDVGAQWNAAAAATAALVMYARSAAAIAAAVSADPYDSCDAAEFLCNPSRTVVTHGPKFLRDDIDVADNDDDDDDARMALIPNDNVADDVT